MSLVIYKVLGLRELKPTFVRLLNTDSSVNELVAIVHDVKIKVASLSYPIDFIILDYEMDTHSPIILGRPFLATSKVLIDMDMEKVTFKWNTK